MPPAVPRNRLLAAAALAAVVLVAAIAALLAGSDRGEGHNRLLAAPPGMATAVPASCAGATARFSAQTTRRVVALTFDDGPSASTARVLGRLHRAGQHATFFVIGRQVADHRAAVRRMARAGHAVGNHSWDHADLSAGDAGAAGELAWTSRAIVRAGGRTPCVMRAPYGRTSDALTSLAARQGMTVAEWDVDPEDWRSPSASTTARAVLAGLHPGAIVLLHDGGPRAAETLAALPEILRGLRRRGYRSVTVPELLHLPG